MNTLNDRSYVEISQFYYKPKEKIYAFIIECQSKVIMS